MLIAVSVLHSLGLLNFRLAGYDSYRNYWTKALDLQRNEMLEFYFKFHKELAGWPSLAQRLWTNHPIGARAAMTKRVAKPMMAEFGQLWIVSWEFMVNNDG